MTTTPAVSASPSKASWDALLSLPSAFHDNQGGRWLSALPHGRVAHDQSNPATHAWPFSSLGLGGHLPGSAIRRSSRPFIPAILARANGLGSHSLARQQFLQAVTGAVVHFNKPFLDPLSVDVPNMDGANWDDVTKFR